MRRGALFSNAFAFSTYILLTKAQSQSLSVDPSNTLSIKQAAASISADLASYVPNDPFDGIGLLPKPYFFWESAAYWNGLLDVGYMSGDTTYNNITSAALLAQRGPNNNYMPPNQTKNEGNDDQGFWALAALAAEDYDVPIPKLADGDEAPTNWTQLAINVFDAQAARWDDKTCGGGLRWQIFTFNAGYNYKNAASQGTFFQLAARLAASTGNKTYADWAEKSWTWMESVGLLTNNSKGDVVIYDGADTSNNCSKVDRLQWSENAGLFIRGASTLWGSSVDNGKWQNRTMSLTDSTSRLFFKDRVMIEPACGADHCNVDQRAFRYYLASALTNLGVSHANTVPTVSALLAASAQAAAKNCLGNGTCGMDWTKSSFDGTSGVGEDLSALGVITGLGIVQGVREFANGTSANGTATSTSTSASPSATQNHSMAGLGRQEYLDGAAFAAVVAVVAMLALL